ncbi:MAG: DUF115 domain-containing protein [Kiritimatiellae bacterium]|nr:DUF115 domain-containing protein [Kiritimatiellia bacterium]
MTDQTDAPMIPSHARVAVVWAEDAKTCLSGIARLCPDLHTFMVVSDAGEELSAGGIPCITIRPDQVTRAFLASLFFQHRFLLFEGRVGCHIEEGIQHRFPEQAGLLMESLLEAVRLAVTQAAFRATKGWHMLYGSLWNLPRVVESATIEPLLGCAHDLPVVVVGAGPALDTDAPLLAAERRRGVVIACDAAWNTLIRHGVRPDVVMCTDTRDCTWQHIERGSREQPGVLLVMPVCGSWSVVRHYPGPICFFRQDWPLDRLIEQAFGSPIPELNPGKCVGNAAFELALWMGAERIILTGFNLGFEGERYHPADRSSAEFHEHPHQESNLRTITGNDGNPMKTDLSMFYYLRNFEEQIAATPTPVWNVTTGGARMDGARRAPLHQAVEKCPPHTSQKIPPVQPSTFNTDHPAYIEFAREMTKAVTAFIREAHNPPPPEPERCDPNALMAHHRRLGDLLHTAENPALAAEVRCMLDLWRRDRDLKDLQARALDARERWLSAQLSTAALIPALLELRPLSAPRSEEWLVIIPPGERAAAAPFLDMLQQKRGLTLRFPEIEPMDVRTLWTAAHAAAGFVMLNGGILPFAWAFTGLRCLDLVTRPADSTALMEQWLPGYEIITHHDLAEAWRRKVPAYIPVATV